MNELEKYNNQDIFNPEYLYPNRPDYVPIDNSDLIPKVLRWYKKGFNINNFYNIYPELKDKFIEELEKANEN